MYAHKVIEDFEKYQKAGLKIGHVIEGIRQAQKFHMGELSGWDHILPKNTFLFSEYLRLPYDTVWLDYNFDMSRPDRICGNQQLTSIYEGLIKKSPPLNSHKRGILARQITDDFILFFVFSHFSVDAEVGSGWQPSLAGEMCCPGRKLKEFPTILAGMGKDSRSLPGAFLDGNVFPFPAFPTIQGGTNNESLTRHHMENADELKAMQVLLMLLDCKNSSTVDNHPPEKLNKKRTKSGKQPLFTYKTLVIKPTGKKQESQAAQGLWDNRIHLCRGHFKEYTAEKPLFGRITGRFWWQPSVRGNKENGIIVKDYSVKASDVGI